ncbi:hypothetical protein PAPPERLAPAPP_01910 [Brevundimonas phage vB_BpoS-Papperlapapp]|nr:hypothetical protein PAPPERLAPAPP_01910 [Brevundimonas phage vB_BpoS-Papperlapapp]
MITRENNMKMDVDRVIRYGVDVGVAVLVIGGYLMGFGVGPFDFNPLNLATATFLLAVWAMGR